MNDLVRLLTLQDANTRTVLLGSGVLGLACGVVGTLAVLRRRALLGDAVAHAALPGVCLAFGLTGDRHLGVFMIGALLFGLLSAALIAAVRTLTRIREDAATAIAIGGFFGLGIAWSKIIQTRSSVGNVAGLESFLFGKAATMVGSDANLIAAVAGSVLLVAALLHKEFKLLCFDRSFGETVWRGPRAASVLDLLLTTLICICVIAGLPAVGVVLVVSLLVIPASAARFWSDRMEIVMLVAGLIGLASGVLGAAVSALKPGFATGPAITLFAAVLFAVSLFLAPGRGIAAGWARRRGLKRRIHVQNLLRRAFELLEPSGTLDAPIARDELERSAGPMGVRRAAGLGLIVSDHSGVRLTKYGAAEAVKVVRAHRLWETFLIEHVSIAPDHVHRDADEMEHMLPSELIVELEDKLRAQGRLPTNPHAEGSSGARA